MRIAVARSYACLLVAAAQFRQLVVRALLRHNNGIGIFHRARAVRVSRQAVFYYYLCITYSSAAGMPSDNGSSKTNTLNYTQMSITREEELIGMQKASEAVAYALKEMTNYARPGMSTKQLDNYGAAILSDLGARSAPLLTYRFPGCTCISVNNEFCHGIPSDKRILEEGDLVNIDVSAELNGFFSDNGGSFVLGEDIHRHRKLIDASREILHKAIYSVKGGVRISDIGHLIETEAKKRGYKVIKNLTGHGIGKSLHEEPSEIANYRDRFNMARFKKNSVVAIETFISTTSTYAETLRDGWTMVGNKGGFMAQHEHTIVVTDGKPLVLTEMNGIWN